MHPLCFDQDSALRQARVDGRSWVSHIDDSMPFVRQRCRFSRSYHPRHGIAAASPSDNPFSVRALAYIIAGHVEHHIDGHSTGYE